MSQPGAGTPLVPAVRGGSVAPRAQWCWAFQDRAGAVLDKPVSPAFTSRFDAEAWLGEHWRGLATDRVSRAQLTAGPDPVGPPVELREA